MGVTPFEEFRIPLLPRREDLPRTGVQGVLPRLGHEFGVLGQTDPVGQLSKAGLIRPQRAAGRLSKCSGLGTQCGQNFTASPFNPRSEPKAH